MGLLSETQKQTFRDAGYLCPLTAMDAPEAARTLAGIVTVTCRELMSARTTRVSCSSDGELPLDRRFGSETA